MKNSDFGRWIKIPEEYNLENPNDVKKYINRLRRENKELKNIIYQIRASDEFHSMFGKTQLIGIGSKKNYSRGDHTLQVTSISKNIIGKTIEMDDSIAPNVKNTQLFKLILTNQRLYAEASALGHDIGHVPFGHVGERSLNHFLGKEFIAEHYKKIEIDRKSNFGINWYHTPINPLRFFHYEQSVYVFNRIIKKSGLTFRYVDLSKIRSAIIGHSAGKGCLQDMPNDLVVWTTRFADKIAYVNSDYYELKEYIKPLQSDDDEVKFFLGMTRKGRVKKFISMFSKQINEYGLTEDIPAMVSLTKLRKINDACITYSVEGRTGLLTSDNEERHNLIMARLIDYYYRNPNEIKAEEKWNVNGINPQCKYTEQPCSFSKVGLGLSLPEIVISFVSSMDNQEAIRRYLLLVKRRIRYGKGNGIEPISGEEIIRNREANQSQKIIAMMKKYGLTESECKVRLCLNQEQCAERLTNKGCLQLVLNSLRFNEDLKNDEQMYELMKKYDEYSNCLLKNLATDTLFKSPKIKKAEFIRE